ncbi:hypothetical protein ANCDUO_21070 [Ancylostoma duodenale]|uniref:Uncharacterized protein n=1 Tax=Ancylostoma duodenale TaxID=51022 RepID=A0A0C2CGH3_9BILA|nr:hypothetical protein ANCDUO_21070 [Ancylostoma duodenale]
MAGVTRLDRICNEDIRNRFGVGTISDKLRESRLQWYGHVRMPRRGPSAKSALMSKSPANAQKVDQSSAGLTHSTLILS